MADLSGSFINPAYATPAQVKQLRDYAEQLQKGSIAPTSTSWAGAIAQGLMGFNAANTANRASRLEQGGIQSAAQQDPTVRMLQGSNALTPSSGVGGAILQQESGNNPNAPMSVNGAIGPGQIMPDTFKQYARAGENINNPAHNAAVSQRIVDDYSQKYGGDPARIATAYFSGPGNVAPPGSPTPWKNDFADGNGKRVSSYVSDISRRLMGQPQQITQAGGVSPQQYGAFQHNPWANPNEQALARGLITPAPTADVYGRPGVASVSGGVHALPVAPNFQPGVLAPTAINAGGASVSTQTPLTAPDVGGSKTDVQSQMQPLMDVAKNIGQQGAALGATSDQVKQSVENAYQTIPIRQTLATMKDDILSHGDKMVWGPTADWVNNLKRSIAQHAPGFMNKNDLEGLASADSFEKLSAQLQTLVGRQVGPTDASLFQGMKSVPGSHNSKEGALALIDMLDQQARQNGEFMIQNQGKIGKPGFDLLAARNQFFEQNPIINPITKNPIRMDLSGKGSGETKTIGNKTYQKIKGIWHESM